MTVKPRIRVKAVSRPVTDGLQNLVANLGTSRDKAGASQYVSSILSQQDVVNAYRFAWLPRKIVDIPALDSCRMWRCWDAQADEITAIEQEERRLGIKGKVLKARISARLFGGAALLIGDGSSDPSKPINPETIRQGGLRYVTVLHKRQLWASDIGRDPASEYFDLPEIWQLATGTGAMARVHASRLVIFQGAQVVDPAMMASDPGWGDPVLQSIYEAVRNADATAGNIASLIFEAKVDTVGIPELMNKLGDPNYEGTLLKRWALAETGKGINGTLLHDAEEILGQKTASFASLPDILDRMLQIVSGAADIPVTRLMGQAPAGMSATGESDLRNYYDRVRASQELEMGPAMMMLDECLIRSALGARPEEVTYRWESLWQMTAKERAEIGKVNADTIATLRGTSLIPDEALGDAAVNMMVESGVMPGLDTEVAEYYAAHPEMTPASETPEFETAEPEDSGGADA